MTFATEVEYSFIGYAGIRSQKKTDGNMQKNRPLFKHHESHEQTLRWITSTVTACTCLPDVSSCPHWGS